MPSSFASPSLVCDYVGSGERSDDSVRVNAAHINALMVRVDCGCYETESVTSKVGVVVSVGAGCMFMFMKK